ncbi:MAG: lipid-A-disaccharide synthase N-terminal domain-containing protein [Candidatus Micrarchaeia archaeon]
MGWTLSMSYPIGIVGILGLVLILVAWIPQTIETIKMRKTGMRREFILLYLLGSTFLIGYSFLLDDFVFVILNTGAVVIAFINLYYSLMHQPRSERTKN